MSDEKVVVKDYTRISTRVLNRAIEKRTKQIEATEKGSPTSNKTLAQLKYELEQMSNALMERSMHKVVTFDDIRKDSEE